MDVTVALDHVKAPSGWEPPWPRLLWTVPPLSSLLARQPSPVVAFHWWLGGHRWQRPSTVNGEPTGSLSWCAAATDSTTTWFCRQREAPRSGRQPHRPCSGEVPSVVPRRRPASTRGRSAPCSAQRLVRPLLLIVLFPAASAVSRCVTHRRPLADVKDQAAEASFTSTRPPSPPLTQECMQWRSYRSRRSSPAGVPQPMLGDERAGPAWHKRGALWRRPTLPGLQIADG